MKQYSIGLIGYGGFGQFLHAAWSRTPGVVVVSVADADSMRKPDAVSFHTEWQGLIDDQEVDIVAIATPPATHATMAIAALRKGKHVLVEKPVATTLSDANQILAARDRAHGVVAVDYMLRFNPIVEALYGWCQSGCFGALRRVAIENFAQDESLPPDHWFWDTEMSGGILVEHAVHFLDLVRWCSGSKTVRVEGVGVHRTPSQEDRMMATVVHESGLVATHYHSFSGPKFFERTTMRFTFDLAHVEIDGWIPMSGRISAIVNESNEAELERLPGLTLTRRTPKQELELLTTDSLGAKSARATVSVSGHAFEMEAMADGVFGISETKSEEYARALGALMSDLVWAIDDPAHSLRVTLEDAIASLETAIKATSHAHGRSSGFE